MPKVEAPTQADDAEVLLRIALTLLAGVEDDECILSRLRGMPHLIRFIFQMGTAERRWKCHIKMPDRSIGDQVRASLLNHTIWENPFEDEDSFCFLTELSSSTHGNDQLEFPPPRDININMMPFILSDSFNGSKLPHYLKGYWPLIKYCAVPEANKSHSMWFDKKSSQIGKVCFLTVQEGFVEAGSSQRRPGLHVDCPGRVLVQDQKAETSRGGGTSRRYASHGWGLGGCHVIPAHPNVDDNRFSFYNYNRNLVLTGGIYMANTVEGSCMGYNCKIVANDNGKEVIGRLGDVEHLRPLLPPAKPLHANRMYWMTDRTPHESLPLTTSSHRQFFRLVTSTVNLWYEAHSTKNPKGIIPDPNLTIIVKGNKFQDTVMERD